MLSMNFYTHSLIIRVKNSKCFVHTISTLLDHFICHLSENSSIPYHQPTQLNTTKTLRNNFQWHKNTIAYIVKKITSYTRRLNHRKQAIIWSFHLIKEQMYQIHFTSNNKTNTGHYKLICENMVLEETDVIFTDAWRHDTWNLIKYTQYVYIGTTLSTQKYISW